MKNHSLKNSDLQNILMVYSLNVKAEGLRFDSQCSRLNG